MVPRVGRLSLRCLDHRGVMMKGKIEGSGFRLLLFDLDGTLLDTGEDIASSVNFVLEGSGLSRLGHDRILGFVGDGVERLLVRSFSVYGKDVPENARQLFRSHYFDHCLDRTVMYEGVREVLDELSSLKKAVVSNKPQLFVDKIIKGLEMGRYFDSVFGGDAFTVKKPRPEPLLEVMGKAGEGREATVIIGDGRNDVLAGKAAGITTVAVTYGFTDPAVLSRLEPDYLIDDIRELKDILTVRSRR